MLFKLIIVFIYVYGILAETTFIDKGSRAELFEIMDNEIPEFRVNLPEEEFNQLKKEAIYPSLPVEGTNLGNFLKTEEFSIRTYIKFLEALNYKEILPEINVSEYVPELNINEEGYAVLDTEAIINDFDLNVKSFENFDFASLETPFYIYLLQRNPNFNIYKILMTIGQFNLSDKIEAIFGAINKANFTPEQMAIINSLISSQSDTINKNFKTKNATMSVEINGIENNFKKITFSIGGKSSRFLSKQGFNIKIRGGQNLYGRSQFRIRPESSEPTYMRSKLTCDILNRLGLPSISANYITLYVNGEYMGLYVLMDAFKLSWAESEFNDKDATNLYQCACNLNFETCAPFCENENDDVSDRTDLYSFLSALDQAQSVEEIEKFFDIDLFLYEIAIEYLIGSNDHFPVNGNNLYLYKPRNESKWKYLIYDFDLEFGHNIEGTLITYVFEDLPSQLNSYNLDFPNYTFSEWQKNKSHVIDVLISNDPSRFETILKTIVEKAFNPAVLYPHINELKERIRSYVELDKTPNEEGHYPGRINNEGYKDYTMEEWDANSEFTTIPSNWGWRSYGLKYWILMRYRNVCKTYSLECDPLYMDENFDYSINKNVEFTDLYTIRNIHFSTTNSTTTTTTTTVTVTSTTVESPTTTDIDPQEPTSSVLPTKYQCWVEIIGYPCCSPGNTKVYEHDDNGDWGYDFKTQEWCGLTPYVEPSTTEECWSEELGYKCCKDCTVFETDKDGKWGYAFKSMEWCGIPTYCPV